MSFSRSCGVISVVENRMIPEIRFEGFTGAWEEMQLDCISGMTYSGGTPSTSKKEFWNGCIPWIQSADVQEHNVSSVYIRKYITLKVVLYVLKTT